MINYMFSSLPSMEGGTNKTTEGVNGHMNVFKLVEGREVGNIHLPQLPRHKAARVDSQMWFREEGDTRLALFNNCPRLFSGEREHETKGMDIEVM